MRSIRKPKVLAETNTLVCGDGFFRVGHGEGYLTMFTCQKPAGHRGNHYSRVELLGGSGTAQWPPKAKKR